MCLGEGGHELQLYACYDTINAMAQALTTSSNCTTQVQCRCRNQAAQVLSSYCPPVRASTARYGRRPKHGLSAQANEGCFAGHLSMNLYWYLHHVSGALTRGMVPVWVIHADDPRHLARDAEQVVRRIMLHEEQHRGAPPTHEPGTAQESPLLHANLPSGPSAAIAPPLPPVSEPASTLRHPELVAAARFFGTYMPKRKMPATGSTRSKGVLLTTHEEAALRLFLEREYRIAEALEAADELWNTRPQTAAAAAGGVTAE